MKYLFLLLIIACSPTQEEARPNQIAMRRTAPSGNAEFYQQQTQDFQTRRIRFLEEGQVSDVEMERISPIRNQGNQVNQEDAIREAPSSNVLSAKDFEETKKSLEIKTSSITQEAEVKVQEGVIEIAGGEKRVLKQPVLKKEVDADLLLPNTNGVAKFIISTSPSYDGIYLEEVKEKLQKFGNLKIVKEGEKFAVKLYPTKLLTTEEEAKILMRQIIKTSFFDIYIENL